MSLQQTLTINLLAVEPLTLHGSPYFDVTYTVEGTEHPPQRMRINPEAFYANPQPGDRVAVNLVMGSIMGAEKL